MKSETKILEDRLLQIRNTLLELQFIKEDIKSLLKLDDKYQEEILDKSLFFKRLYSNYWRLFIIDVFKLTGENEDHNIRKLLEFCKINRRKIEWNTPISLNELNVLSDKLDSVSDKNMEIEGLRNKHYAHNDKNKKSFSYEINFSNLWDILEELQSIFGEINLKFKSTHWYFDVQYKTPEIIPDLYKYQQILKLTIEEKESLIKRVLLMDIITS